MKRTSLDTDEYSAAHPSIFNIAAKRRLANQAIRVIESFVHRQQMHAISEFSCLDIACGAGITSHEFSDVFRSVTGIDIDRTAIEFAKRSFQKKNLRFIHGDATKLPLPRNHFDVVICQEVYSYVQDAVALMKEIFRVLRSGGICYLVGDNLLFPFESQYRFPFLHYLPDPMATALLKLLGNDRIWLGHYKTYWGLKGLCRQFTIRDYTLIVLNDPNRFGFTKLVKYRPIVRLLPRSLQLMLVPFVPTFIWILKKPFREKYPEA